MIYWYTDDFKILMCIGNGPPTYTEASLVLDILNYGRIRF